MTTSSEIRTKYDVFRVYEMVSDRLTQESIENPDDELLEERSERAYEDMWRALDGLADALVEFTGGQLDRFDVRRMAMSPKYRGRLDDLMRRLAA